MGLLVSTTIVAFRLAHLPGAICDSTNLVLGESEYRITIVIMDAIVENCLHDLIKIVVVHIILLSTHTNI